MVKQTQDRKKLIEIIKQQIVSKANLESTGKLTQKDYEYICFLVEEKTKIALSVSTLKRIWKNDYERIPHESTLDALAVFAGYESWNKFKQQNTEGHLHQKLTQKRRRNQIIISAKKKIFLSSTALVAILLLLFFFNRSNSGKTTGNTETASFSINKTVSIGVPNTVVFNYDVTKVQADSFFIQQSWKRQDRVKIDRNKHFLTDIYYYPGFHEAKLMANKEIIKRENILITTDGWLPIISRSSDEGIPVYVRSGIQGDDGNMAIQESVLQEFNINRNDDFKVRFFNVQEFEDIGSKGYRLETKIKINPSTTNACPVCYISIMTKRGMSYIPFTQKGCESNIGLKISNDKHNGKVSDLSVFGCQLSEWQELALNVTDSSYTIHINDNLSFQGLFSRPSANIAGFVIFFNDLGEVDYFRLYDSNNRLVFGDEFN